RLKGFTATYKDALDQPIAFAPDRSGSGGGPPGGGFGGPSFSNLTDLYFAQAKADANVADTCSSNGYSAKLATSDLVVDDCKGVAVPDAGAPRADAGRVPPPNCPPPPSGTIAASSLTCEDFSDISAAMIGMHPDTVWLTRLEANLPRESLAADLKIKPSNPQDPVSNVMRAAVHVNPPCDLLENHPEVMTLKSRSQQAGIGVLSGI